MKKYIFFCIPAFVILSQNTKAQLQVPELPAQKKTEMLFVFPAIKSAESVIQPAEKKIKFVHIDLLEPSILTIKTAEFINKAKANCSALKELKPTLTLKAERANNLTANLQWETKYAFYATGFDIEKSLGDSLHFSTINFAAVSKGSSFKKNYHLPDHNDYSGLSFYRIKQRNGDTGFVYSNIVSLKGYDCLLYTSPSPRD